MHLLLTRPKSDDDPLPDLLRARGHSVTHDPLLRIDVLAAPEIDVSGLQVIAVTSSNALRALSLSPLLPRLRSIPVFAVGDATAAAATALGFSDVRRGEGTAKDLLPALVADLKPAAGAVLYLRGEEIAFDLAAPLTASGFAVQNVVVYRAVAAKAFASETIAGFARGTLSGVVLMSPRTAETYVHLAETAGLASELSFLKHFCLSQRVAEPLGDLPDVSVRIAKQPNLQELVALIDLDATQS